MGKNRDEPDAVVNVKQELNFTINLIDDDSGETLQSISSAPPILPEVDDAVSIDEQLFTEIDGDFEDTEYNTGDIYRVVDKFVTYAVPKMEDGTEIESASPVPLANLYVVSPEEYEKRQESNEE